MIKKEGIRICFFILIVLFINFVNSETSSPSACLKLDCEDNGKVSDVYNKGKIEFQGQTYTDSCKDGIETEVSCDGNNKIKKEVFICPNGCKDEFSCSDISIEVEMKVPEKFKIKHALPTGEMEYEKAGLDELKAEGKCLDCGTQEDKDNLIGIITKYDDLEIKAVLDFHSADFNPAGYSVYFKIEGADSEGEMMLSNCDFADNKYTCIKNFESFGEGLFSRGTKINAKVELIKNSETIQTKKSKSFVVAGLNYYFIHVLPGPRVNNYKEQYGFYTSISAVNNNLESSGKPIYLNNEISVSVNEPNKVEDESDRQFNFKQNTLNEVSGFLKSAGYGLDRFNDRVIALSDYLGSAGGFTELRSSVVFSGSGFLHEASHELGHTYGLCDEYVFFGFLGYGYAIQEEFIKCSNYYPKCCLDSPDNEININLEKEAKKPFRDEVNNFQYWVVTNKAELSNEDLLDLRLISPCAKIGGECKYWHERDEFEGYYQLTNVISYRYCPPEDREKSSIGNCYISLAKLRENGQTNCYASFDESKMMPKKCAGMPLDDKTNLNSPYRSLMGYAFQPSETRKYPPEARWPLTENKKEGLVFEEGKRADETQLMYACQEEGRCTKKTFQELLARAEIHNWEIELKNEFGADYKTLRGYTPLDEKLIYAMMNVETSPEISRTIARQYDPMQIANAEDFALGVLRDGKEGLTAYNELANIQNTPWKRVYNTKKGEWEKRLDYNRVPIENRINEKLSIEYGIRWLWHKKKVRDNQGNIVSFRTWEEAVRLYNGGGDPQYLNKVMKEYKKLGGNWKQLQ